MLILRKEQVNSMLRREVFHMLSLGKGFVKIKLRKCKFYVNSSPRNRLSRPRRSAHVTQI